MGNSFSQTLTRSNNRSNTLPGSNGLKNSKCQLKQIIERQHDQQQQQHRNSKEYTDNDNSDYIRKSKSLPIRRSNEVNNHPNYEKDNKRNSTRSPSSSSATATATAGATVTASSRKNGSSNGETSRVLFLLYLIHRTWNVVVETVDTRSKRLVV